MLWLCVIVLILFILVILDYKFIYKHNSLRKLPFPKNIWLLGNAWSFGSDGVAHRKHISKLNKSLGDLFIVKFLTMRTVFTSGAAAAEAIFSSTKNLDKGLAYQLLKEWLGSGLLVSSGEKWRKHRKILTPAFHFNILEQFIDVFDDNSKILVEKLQTIKPNEFFDIVNYISLCTLDIICETAMGVSISAQSNPSSEYVNAVQQMRRILQGRMGSVLKRFDVSFQFTTDGKIHRQCIKVLHDFSEKIIKERMREIEDGGLTLESLEHFDGTKKKVAFLDLLLLSKKDGKPFTLKEIRDEVDTFMFEGHDTTSAALSFALYELSRNADVQRKAYEEQIEILGDLQRNVSHRELNEMKYLDMVIKETLRLYPPVPVLSRHIKDDMSLGNGIIVPKGYAVTVDIFSLHRSEKYHKDPTKFDPNRFLANKIGENFSYVPFSAGQRNCIGQRFAMLEIKSTLSKIIRNFELYQPENTPHEVILKNDLVLASDNGVKLCLRKR